jgi:indolepyruvate ferredoxin oxidoreductase alpha subunit
MTGNEAIARGAWEAGVRYASAYPGTPSTEILENVAHYKDIYSEWAPNEKVAVESAIGAAFAGARSMAAMKHVGLNVAADPLFTCGYTGVNGGLMIISADDPGLHSSQDEQDNRYYARAAKVAMLEPSNSQEAKDFVAAALELSEQYDMPVLLRLTTRVCHSKSIVNLDTARTEYAVVPYEKKDKFNPIPAISKGLHTKVEKNLKALEQFSNSTPLNFTVWGDRKIGVVSAGAAYQYAREVFGDNASYLKLGFTFPLPMQKIRDFAAQVDQLIVVEELEPIMETEIRAAGIPCVGKDKIPCEGELNPDILRKALLGEEHETIDCSKTTVAQRPPVLCAGCPHRGFFYELQKMKNVVTVSDIGCYGLAPKDIAICMGGGFSVAHGAQKVFNMTDSGKRCVGIMGDSTFFHSGMTSMLEAVYNHSNVLMVVLDNRITGMTGHQQNPGSGFTLGEAALQHHRHRGSGRRLGRAAHPHRESPEAGRGEGRAGVGHGLRRPRRADYPLALRPEEALSGGQGRVRQLQGHQHRGRRQVRRLPRLRQDRLPRHRVPCGHQEGHHRSRTVHRLRCLHAGLPQECHFPGGKVKCLM